MFANYWVFLPLLTLFTHITVLSVGDEQLKYRKNLRRCHPFISEIENFDFPDCSNEAPGFIEISQHEDCDDIISNYVLVALKTCEFNRQKSFVHGYYSLQKLKWAGKKGGFQYVVLTNEKNKVGEGFTYVERIHKQQSESFTSSCVRTRAAERKRPNIIGQKGLPVPCNPTTIFVLADLKEKGKLSKDLGREFKRMFSHGVGKSNGQLKTRDSFEPDPAHVLALRERAVDVMTVTTIYRGEDDFSDEWMEDEVEGRLSYFEELFSKNHVKMASLVIEAEGLKAGKSFQRCDQGFLSSFTHGKDEDPPPKSLWADYYGVSYEYAEATAGSENACHFNADGFVKQTSWPLIEHLKVDTPFVHFYLQQSMATDETGQGNADNDDQGVEGEEDIVSVEGGEGDISAHSYDRDEVCYVDEDEGPVRKRARLEEEEGSGILVEFLTSLKNEIREVLQKLNEVAGSQEKNAEISDKIMEKVTSVADKLIIHSSDAAAVEAALRLRVQKAVGINVPSERIASDPFHVTYLVNSGLKTTEKGSDTKKALETMMKKYGHFLKVVYSESDPEKTLIYCGVCTKHHELKNVNNCPNRAEGEEARKKHEVDKHGVTGAPRKRFNNVDTRGDLERGGLCTSDVGNVENLNRRVHSHDLSVGHKQNMATAETLFQTASRLIDRDMGSSVLFTENYATIVLWVLQTNVPMEAIPRVGELVTRLHASTGHTHFTKQSGKNMAECIRIVAREHLRRKLMNTPFHLLCDGSTDNGLDHVVVFQVTFFEEVGMIPVTYHFAMIELEDGTADGYLKAFEKAMKEYEKTGPGAGMWSVMQKNLVSIASDAASTMTGVHKGFHALVEKKLQEDGKKRSVFLAKCRNHQLQNSLKMLKSHDSVLMVTYLVNEIHSFLSSESRYKIRNTFDRLGELLKIQASIPSKIVGIRWISFMHRSVKVLLKSYYALIDTFISHEQNEDVSVLQQERASYIAVIMRDPRIYLTVYTLNFFLERISNTSEAIQTEGVSMWKADHLMQELRSVTFSDFDDQYEDGARDPASFGLYCANKLGAKKASACTKNQIQDAFLDTSGVISSSNPIFYLKPLSKQKVAEPAPSSIPVVAPKGEVIHILSFDTSSDIKNSFRKVKERRFTSKTFSSSDDDSLAYSKEVDANRLSKMYFHYEDKFLDSHVTPKEFLEEMIEALADGIRRQNDGQILETFAVSERLLLLDALVCPEGKLFSSCPYVVDSLDLSERKSTSYSGAMSQRNWDDDRETQITSSVEKLKTYYPLTAGFSDRLNKFLKTDVPAAVSILLSKHASPLPDYHTLHQFTSVGDKGFLVLLPNEMENMLDYGQLLGIIDIFCASSTLIKKEDYIEIISFLKAIRGVPGSTASVERSFSAVNYFKEGSSSTMTVEVADMRLMSKNLPPASEFDMHEVRQKWISKSEKTDGSSGKTTHKHITRRSCGLFARIASIRDGNTNPMHDVCPISPQSDDDITVINDDKSPPCMLPEFNDDAPSKGVALRKLAAAHSVFSPVRRPNQPLSL